MSGLDYNMLNYKPFNTDVVYHVNKTLGLDYNMLNYKLSISLNGTNANLCLDYNMLNYKPVFFLIKFLLFYHKASKISINMYIFTTLFLSIFWVFGSIMGRQKFLA